MPSSTLRSKHSRLFRRSLSLAITALLFLQHLVFVVPVARALTTGSGSISLNASGSVYTQDFNTLANTGTSGALPTGWYFDETGTNANTLYTAGTGSSNSGDIYSFGESGSVERAFGTLLSGSLTPVIGAKFTNNTGSTITSLDLSYTGEQWRLGAANRTTPPTVDRLVFQLSTDATSLTSGTFTGVSSLDFSSPNSTGTAGALNGNLAANRATVSTTISNLSIPNGASFFIRWTDLDASSADDGLAIDDFSITPHSSSGDAAPFVSSTTPGPNGTEVLLNADIVVNFSEPVNLSGLWYTINCQTSGGHAATVSGGPTNFTLDPTVNFTVGEQCTVKIIAPLVSDQDANDPPDQMAADYTWTFTTTGSTRDPDQHLVMGNPTGATADVQNENNYLMKKPEYALSYNRSRAIPNWTSWHLDSSWLGSQTRTETYRADTSLPADWYHVNENSYSGSGFDRGHMTPSGDRTFSFEENSATFVMTNMVPQASDNNQNTWEGLESYSRTLVGQGNELYIISGGHGQGGTGRNGFLTTVDQGRVVVPAKTWKVILVLPAASGDDVARVTSQTRTIAVIVPNEQGVNPDWRNYVVSVDEVEALTGYNFFSNVPENIQNIIEANADGRLFFSAANYNVAENASRATVTVSRTGDLSQAVTVDYYSSDTAGLTPCAEAHGTASERCDYASVAGTLNFVAGESAKTIFIPVVDDAYVEGNEIFTLTLKNALGGALGTQATANITILDNDSGGAQNPIDQTPFFVRQHYIDFLGREPDPDGLAAWQNILNNCGTTVQPPCDRIEVSSAFFRSEEFQSRGYFIYRFYSAVGKIPHYPEFMSDFPRVSGFLSPEQLEANKAAFVQEFMSRPDFQTKYGSLTDPTAYVDALLQTVGLPNHPTRGFWINGLTGGTLTRADVLRGLVDSAEVYQKYYNEAFVVMQYFGYLRRDPDILYLEWIRIMNENGGDYRVMINGFMNSAEYRQRFGQ
ncbi:MAG TPA: DNA/RNA non-specific endonuclease [Pyrinomonadaceae bacterium]